MPIGRVIQGDQPQRQGRPGLGQRSIAQGIAQFKASHIGAAHDQPFARLQPGPGIADARGHAAGQGPQPFEPLPPERGIEGTGGRIARIAVLQQGVQFSRPEVLCAPAAKGLFLQHQLKHDGIRNRRHHHWGGRTDLLTALGAEQGRQPDQLAAAQPLQRERSAIMLAEQAGFAFDHQQHPLANRIGAAEGLAEFEALQAGRLQQARPCRRRQELEGSRL